MLLESMVSSSIPALVSQLEVPLQSLLCGEAYDLGISE